MSLIIDALEKVQKQTRPVLATADWLVVDRPVKSMPVVIPVEPEPEKAVNEERATHFGLWGIVFFGAIVMGLGVLGFKILSSDFSLSIGSITTASTDLSRGAGAIAKTAELPVLRGVLQDPGGSFCILGEQILKLGDTWRGYTVTSIEARHVVVRDAHNRLLTLQLQES